MGIYVSRGLDISKRGEWSNGYSLKMLLWEATAYRYIRLILE